MSTLQRTTDAAEELALHSPVVITIVKPDEEETPVHFSISNLKMYLNGRGRRNVQEANSPYLVSSFNGPVGEESYPGKA